MVLGRSVGALWFLTHFRPPRYRVLTSFEFFNHIMLQCFGGQTSRPCEPVGGGPISAATRNCRSRHCCSLQEHKCVERECAVWRLEGDSGYAKENHTCIHVGKLLRKPAQYMILVLRLRCTCDTTYLQYHSRDVLFAHTAINSAVEIFMTVGTDGHL